ncbi:MAG TPA: flippase-like domain-containing protein, partial [Polyangiaceae bacterium]|nr:flippase-like domain-containing protein [Polyangiaceae bacterium]
IAFGSTSLPGGVLWASLGAAGVAGLLVFVTFPAISTPVVRGLVHMPGRAGALMTKIVPKLEAMLVQLRVLTTPRRLVLPTLLSVVGWSLEGVGVWLIVRGFGVRAEIAPVAFAYSTATLAGALVPIPGGLGVVEKVLEETMVAVAHVPGAIATATMRMARLATLWFAVAVGFLALGILRARNPSLLAGKPAAPSGDAAA